VLHSEEDYTTEIRDLLALRERFGDSFDASSLEIIVLFVSKQKFFGQLKGNTLN